MRVCLLASLCGAVLAADPLGPGSGPWDVEPPSAHGLSQEALDTAAEYMFTIGPGTEGGGGPFRRDCVVVIKDGALVYEKYSSEQYKITNHDGWSQTKTLGALLAGYAVTHGGLDIDADITAKYGVKSPKSYPVTSRQIMSQAIGGRNAPGEDWEYDAAGGAWINQMPAVVKAATGMKASEIWQDKFQKALGTNITWNSADSVWAYGSKGTCRDYARMGQLMLNRGSWKGVSGPLISPDYIGTLSTPQTKDAPYANYTNPCYGLLTWLSNNVQEDGKYPGKCKMFGVPASGSRPSSEFPKGTPEDVFYADGMYGQVTMVIPSHNAVVVSMGYSSQGKGEYEVPTDMYKGLCLASVFNDPCDLSARVIV